MKKYEYGILELKEDPKNWRVQHWYLGEKCLTTSFLGSLNSIGQEGWQVVFREYKDSYMVMREIQNYNGDLEET